MVDVFKCARAAVYHNTARLTPAQIKAETGCTHIINGGFFNTKFQPCGWLVIDGKVIVSDQYQDWGFALGDGWGPEMHTDRSETFISAVPILKDGKRLTRELTADVARTAARTAVGWFPNGRVLLWCDKAILTREQLQDKLLGMGVSDALMFDGGGSTQGIFPDGKVESGRLVPTLLLFWAEGYEKEEKPMEPIKKVCLDAGHDAGNLANASPDGTYFEHEFALDMAKRIRAILETAGVQVVETRPDGNKVSLAERCRISNAAGADLFVSLHSNAAGTPGWSSARGWEAYVYGLSGKRYEAAKAILARVEGVAPAIRSTPIQAKPDLSVLNGTAAPAVLIEHGFHTNKEDVAWMKDDACRQRLAQAEAYGILDWLGIAVPEAEKSEAELAVEWITESGIMLGNADGDLMLDEPVTRRQFATMLYRYHREFKK